MLILAVSCKTDMDVTELTDWEFEYNDQWYSAKVPGCIHTDLMAHNLIPDPFYATNEDSVQWVGKRGWKYRTIITRDMWEGFEHCDLVLDGATYCDVWLSGESFGTKFQTRVMTIDNMFREYRVCLFDVLLDNKELPDLGDEAVLEITFYPIEQNNENHFATEVSEEDGHPWPDMDYDLPDHRAMSRMAPYMLGWDWGPKLSTVGVLGSARLECYNDDLPEKPVTKPKSWGVTLKQEQDSIGQSFTFYRNGKPLFVKTAPATATCSPPPRRPTSICSVCGAVESTSPTFSSTYATRWVSWCGSISISAVPSIPPTAHSSTMSKKRPRSRCAVFRSIPAWWCGVEITR